jgi:hypothetical protein
MLIWIIIECQLSRWFHCVNGDERESPKRKVIGQLASSARPFVDEIDPTSFQAALSERCSEIHELECPLLKLSILRPGDQYGRTTKQHVGGDERVPAIEFGSSRASENSPVKELLPIREVKWWYVS